MRNKKYILHTIIGLLFAIMISGCSTEPGNYKETGTLPNIFPDYTFVTIPANIAPLNFRIEGAKDRIFVEFKCGSNTLKVTGKGKIDIPIKKWRKLLNQSKGDSLIVTVSSLTNNKWNRHKSFSIYVSQYDIDSHMAYRLIAPGYENWSKMGIYQRDLTSFKQKAIIENTLITGSCVNCHSFKLNDPENMMFHLRSPKGGTFVIQDDVIKNFDTKSQKTISTGVYPFWHPSGDYITFSVNLVKQAFHTSKEKRIEVFDSKSDVVVLDIKNNKMLTSELLSDEKEFETFPTFSPDGKYLYFISAKAKEIPLEYNQIRYNLKRIRFNQETGSFGNEVEELLNADSLNKTVTIPRISPDGKYLMFTMADYGNFTIWHKEADLYLMDLNNFDYRPLNNANSNDTESYHSWSSDSRWFVFSSRRTDGLYTRPYISFLGDDGKEGKAFLVPQKDPDYYSYLLQSYNIPELITGEVDVDHIDIESVALKGKPIRVD